jgi:hypothetical protein
MRLHVISIHRLENRAEAAEGWAVATKASVAEVAAHLSRERAAHRRTQGGV